MKLLGLRGRGLFPLVTAVAVLIGAGNGLLGVCGPLVDVADDGFCPFVLEIFYLGITTGTSPTTYDPTSNVNRLQMAAFLSRTVDRALQRGSRRSALDQFWTSQNATVLGLTAVGTGPELPKSDGADVWVSNYLDGTISRVRASDGKLLETWFGATGARGVLVAMGRVLAAGYTNPGALYMIDPGQAAGAVTTVATNVGYIPVGITFDGARVWTANLSGSISIITPGATIPWTVTTVTIGQQPMSVLYDGANVWVTQQTAGTVLRLDSAGGILQTVTVGSFPYFLAFDGSNLWVPNFSSNSISVVRASSGFVLQTLTGNGLNNPVAAAFDGERMLVTNEFGDSVSLWRAANLTPLDSFPIGSSGTFPFGACSDGVNFWIALNGTGKLVRF